MKQTDSYTIVRSALLLPADCCLPCSACARCPRRPVHRLPSSACRLLTRQAQRGKSAPATCHVVKGGLVPRKSYVCPPRNFSGQSAIA